MDRQRLRPHLVLAAVLAAVTIAVYLPVFDFRFVNYDDDVYVTENSRIGQGLTRDNVAWSATAFVAGNWHPLTLVSHMIDVSLFGLDPAGHHGMNLVFHVANVVLLFWLLAGTTLKTWPSALVAALFAVHPLNVQTVAWISERKSVLSTTFWLLALLAHVAYRRRPGVAAYLSVVACAALALASKPMAVTLPLTLVLIDYWPLAVRPTHRGWVSLRDARELLPIVVLAGVSAVLTLKAQHAIAAIQSVTAFSWPVRLGNAVVSYAWYLKATFWPSGLAVFYPHPMASLGFAQIAASALLFVALCSTVVVKGRAFPALATGWWWYVATLLPVAGLIQVGSQAYADRYAYVPLIGIFIAIAWLAVRATEAISAPWRRVIVVASLAWIAALSLTTRAQLPHWRDSVSLFQRAIDVVPNNALAQNNLGMAFVEEGNVAEALAHFQEAVALAPMDTDARSNLGNALRVLGRPAEAVIAYDAALSQLPGDASIHYNLATALIDVGRRDDAVAHLNDAVKLDPEHAKARFLLGVLLAQQGRIDESLAQFREVVRLDPRNEQAGEWVRRIEAERERRAH
jgi:tetratricopeptide (TPR) repeat protein